MDASRIEGLQAQRKALVDRVQAMLGTPPDQRPKSRTASLAWLIELEQNQRLVENVDRLLSIVTPKPTKPTKAAAARRPKQYSDAGDSILLARIPKGPRVEVRIVEKTWDGRRLIDVRAWQQRKGSDEFGPTRMGVALDAQQLPALVEALQRSLKRG
jgi:hypothetical protein